MQIPENITKHHGIEASALGKVGADEPAVYSGLDSWRPLVSAALLLLRHTDKDVVRIMTGTHVEHPTLDVVGPPEKHGAR